MAFEQVSNGEINTVELGSAMTKIRARGRFCDKDALDFVPTPESLYFYIDTPLYDGPLDLLLHLIRKHSMDIFDIPIVMITKKYLEAMDEMRNLNLDIAGEFLVMAATLAEIKSKMLLPKEERSADEVAGDEEQDPRAALIERLLLYKSFKEASAELVKRPILNQDVFFRTVSESQDDSAFNESSKLAPIGLYELVDKFAEALKRVERLSVHTITRDRISVSARVHELFEFCKLKPRFTFYDVLRFFPLYEKIDVIVSFLALLEMSRLKLVRIQKTPSEELLIAIVKENIYNKEGQTLKNMDLGKEHGYE